MFSDVEITKASAEQLLAKAPEFDVIITAESKGIPLAYEMARQAGINDYIVARKRSQALHAERSYHRGGIHYLQIIFRPCAWVRPRSIR